MKDLRRFFYRHTTPGTLIVAALAIVFLLIFLLDRGREKMIADCVATTGRDYYECRALVKAGSASPPVIINPGRF